MVDQFNIGALAREAGVKVVTIRYYEQIGILPRPDRSEGNFRIYTRAHAEKLQFIRRCRELGFSLEQIRDLFRLSSENTGTCQEVCAIADRHLASVEGKLADLKRLASELRRIRLPVTGTDRWPSAGSSKRSALHNYSGSIPNSVATAARFSNSGPLFLALLTLGFASYISRASESKGRSRSIGSCSCSSRSSHRS